MSSPAMRIDVRQVPPPQRHYLIFSTFEALPAGGSFEIVNDHDPVPLYRQFESRHLGRFGWEYLEAGPQQWQVRIGKLAQGAPSGNADECCGCSCQGH